MVATDEGKLNIVAKAVILGGIIWLVLSGSAIFIHAAQKMRVCVSESCG
ncbi:MAG: hypothetical protein M5U34_33285 [Chloroflexi bacterium]|nr:hypothetical protein [Chloroflexota bacterium]